MLNEAMDQVVLVKGWKKGANWSFPRGKINKDEDDLDCAVREVYEETGFDIRAAGLVKEAKEMKYIEVTMREQHMRLYVFRGVPMDSHFEPRTRKEISKIEWYKLNDLPTLKRNRQQEGMGEQLATANKFYMVAPFLVPLKKWISQQRKRESRVSSHTLETIPIVSEGPLTDYEIDVANGLNRHATGPSDLPEVSQTQASSFNPSLHLKQLLDIEQPAEMGQGTPQSLPRVDTAKSNALLALLRRGSRPDIPDVPKPSTPFDQVSFPPDLPRSPHRRHPRPADFSILPPPAPFSISPFRAASDAPVSVIPPTSQSQIPNHLPLNSAPDLDSSAQIISHQQVAAPYRVTGDPDFSHPHFAPASGSRVPPASALPPLTHHTRALLDVFKSAAPLQQPPAAHPCSPTHKPSHTAAPPNDGKPSYTTVPVPASVDPSSLLPALLANRAKAQNRGGEDSKQAAMDHKAGLLGLFKNVPLPAAAIATSGSSTKPPAPVELAASSTPGMQGEETPQNLPLATSLEQNPSAPTKALSHVNGVSRNGPTSATISGPLNQPQFGGFAKSSHLSSLLDDPVRSPAPPHKTLFDPNRSLQKKLLTRPVGVDHPPVRSTKPIKPPHAESPRKTTAHKATSGKPFQPRILRRPAADQKDSPLQSTAQPTFQTSVGDGKAPPPTESSSQIQTPLQSLSDGCKPEPDSQKQALLSLFGNSSPLAQTSVAQPPASVPTGKTGNTSISPPAPISTVVSPLTQKTTSTTSRLASLVSVATSTGSQGRLIGEKRQTAPGDKAFLLGYLGRIANQDG